MTLKLGVPKEETDLSVPVTMKRGSGLARYEALKVAIAKCHRVDEAKDIRDRASAFRAYAAQAQDRELLRMAAEIVLRAERRAGALLGDMAESGAREGQGGDRAKSQAATLRDLGIKKDQSARWQLAASVPEADFTAWLGRHPAHAVPTASGLRSYAKIRAAQARNAATLASSAVDGGGSLADLERLAFEQPNHFAVIYADVPAEFETWSTAGQGRAPSMKYPTMSVAELVAMGPLVQALAAPDCALLFWTWGPHLENAFTVMTAWGFTYKTVALTWAKTNPKHGGSGDFGVWHIGNGKWTRANPELCLLATRGAPLRLARDVEELLIAPRGAHSAKPEEARVRIERLLGGPYLELFARQETKGWCSWGNQTNKGVAP